MKLENRVLFVKGIFALAIIFAMHPSILDMNHRFVERRYESPALPAPMVNDEQIEDREIYKITHQYREGIQRQGVNYKETFNLDRRRDWSFEPFNVGIHGASKASPAVDDSGVYVGTDASWFYAFDHDGNLRWKHFVGNSLPGIHSTAALDEKFVYFAAYNGLLYKFTKDEGKMVWAIDLGDANGASPALHGEHIYLAVETNNRPPNGYVAKVSRTSGKIVWRSPWLGQQAHSSPTLDLEKNQLYLGANNGKLFALSLQDGSLIWEQNIGGEIKGTVTLIRDRIIFASWNGFVEARRTSDGSKIWQHDLGDKSQSSATFVPDSDLVIIGANSGWMKAFHVESGEVAWQIQTGWNRLRASALVIREDRESPSNFANVRDSRWIALMPCEELKLCAMDANSGRILKKYELSSVFTAVPVVHSKGLYLAQDQVGGFLRLKGK